MAIAVQSAGLLVVVSPGAVHRYHWLVAVDADVDAVPIARAPTRPSVVSDAVNTFGNITSSSVNAATRFTRPYPNVVSRPSAPMSVAVRCKTSRTCAAVIEGWAANSNAAAPVTNAAAMLVPL